MNRYTAFIIVLCAFAIKVSFIGTDFYIYHTAAIIQIVQVCFMGAQAIAYLLYPLLGWLLDVYFTRYTVIRLAFIIMSLSCCGAVI